MVSAAIVVFATSPPKTVMSQCSNVWTRSTLYLQIDSLSSLTCPSIICPRRPDISSTQSSIGFSNSEHQASGFWWSRLDRNFSYAGVANFSQSRGSTSAEES